MLHVNTTENNKNHLNVTLKWSKKLYNTYKCTLYIDKSVKMSKT